MQYPKAAILVATAATLALGGCAADSGPKENSGTVIGAVSGALIGSAIGGGTGEQIGAAMAGAAIGGLLGNRIGASMDDQDRQYAYEAQMNALDRGAPGTPVGWQNPNSGRYGNFVPGPAHTRGGNRCRSYTQTVYINGRPTIDQGTACRNPDGSWTAVG